MAEPPEDPLRYHAALELSVELGREVVRTQYQAFLDSTRRREELARLMLAVAGGALGFLGLLTGWDANLSLDLILVFLGGLGLNLFGIGMLGADSDVTRFREGPSLEAIAAQTATPLWTHDKLLLSLVHVYPLIRRKNAEVLARAARVRGAAFLIFAISMLVYLSAGAYILWRVFLG